MRRVSGMRTDQNTIQAEPYKKSGCSRETIKAIQHQKPALKESEPEHTIDDEGEDINATAVIGDAVINLVTGDDEDESTTFILCLAAAGAIFSIISYVYNKDNSDVLTGIYIFIAGYAVLLLRILPFWLTSWGIGCLLASVFGSGTTLLLWLSLALLGTGLLGYLIRYLLPQSFLRIIKKMSWVFMFAGPFVMISGGADKTGALCMMVSVVWSILFFITWAFRTGR